MIQPSENGANYRSPDNKRTPFYITMDVINTITHVLLGIVSLSAFFFVNITGGSASFRQHIFLCVTGYVILMSTSILSISPNTGWATSFSLKNKRIFHWVLQILGSSLAIIGSSIRIANFTNNFSAIHGTLGIVALILTCLSLIGGLINLYPTTLRLSPKWTKIFHGLLGASTVSVAFVCLCFGFHNTYRSIMGDTNANLSIAFTVVALVGVLLSPFINMYERISR